MLRYVAMFTVNVTRAIIGVSRKRWCCIVDYVLVTNLMYLYYKIVNTRAFF